MSPGFRGDTYGGPSEKDREFNASKNNPEEKMMEKNEEIVSIPDSEIKIDVNESNEKPIHEESIEISPEKMEGVNVDEKESDEENLENISVKKGPEMTEEVGLESEDIKAAQNTESGSEINKNQDIAARANIENKPKVVGLSGIRNGETTNEHFKEISEKEKPKDIVAGEVSEVKWNGMVKELEDMLKEAASSNSPEKLYEIILHIGEMNKRDSKRFKELKKSEKNPFNDEIKVEMIQEIEATSKKGEEIGEKADPLKLASEVDNFLECFPEYKGKINITSKNKEDIKQNADEYRSRASDYAVEDLASLKSKGDQWKVKKTKEAEKMIKNKTESGEIKVAA